jgi:ADP-sugar diphosphatase
MATLQRAATGSLDSEYLSFILPDFTPSVRVRYKKKDITEGQVMEFPAFSKWVTTMKSSLSSQYTDKNHPSKDDHCKLMSVEVQSVDFFGENVGFVKIKA